MSTEWRNFEEVTVYVLAGRRLFRASAPNYTSGDSSQNLTQTAANFLRSRGITRIISFNAVRYTQAEINRATAAGIFYLHLPVVDYGAPTLVQLQRAFDFFSNAPNASTLVHCGFGHGRTGTGVTAIQLYSTRGVSPAESTWRTVNHVEMDVQIQVLQRLRDGLRSQVHDELW